MSATSLQQPMLRWERNALKAGVMSLREVSILRGCLLLMEETDVPSLPLPGWMHPSCDRLNLFEMQAASRRRQ